MIHDHTINHCCIEICECVSYILSSVKGSSEKNVYLLPAKSIIAYTVALLARTELKRIFISEHVEMKVVLDSTQFSESMATTTDSTYVLIALVGWNSGDWLPSNLLLPSCDIVVIGISQRPVMELINAVEVTSRSIIQIETCKMTSTITITRWHRLDRPCDLVLIPLVMLRTLVQSSCKHLYPLAVPRKDSPKHGKLVFQYQSEGSNIENPSPSPPPASLMTVWTAPAPVSSLEYLLSVLRACGHSPSVFLALSSLISKRVRVSAYR